MKTFGCLAALVLAAALVFGLLFVSQAYLGSPRAGSPVSFEVKAGERAADVALRLVQAQVISSAFWYRVYARVDRSADRPKAGTYQLRPGLSLHDLARALSLGVARREVSLTVIEGWTVDEIAAKLLEAERVDPASTRRAIGQSADRAPFDPVYRTEFPFLKDLPRDRSLDGYLFPNTYRVWADQLPESLVTKQLEEFSKRFGDVRVTGKSAPLTTLDQVVTLASIVENEVRTTEDRRVVAGIFLNRLKQGMALQSDATLTYVTGSKRSRSTAEDLNLVSPYNTYRNKGLPPGPIGNPGEDVINAVLDPASTPYLYFLTEKEGKVLYARTLDEHVANKARAGY